MTLAGLSLRNLVHQRVRTLLTLASVAFAIAALVCLLALARGLATTLVSTLENRGTDIVVSEAGAPDMVSSVVEIAVMEPVGAVPGVRRVAPEITRVTTLPNGATVGVVAWPLDSFLWQGLSIVAGRLPGAADADVAVLGTRLAERIDAAIGDRVRLMQRDLTVIGIADSPSYLNRNLAFLLHADLARYTHREGRTSIVHVQLATDLGEEARGAALAAIRAALPDHAVDPSEAFISGTTVARLADALSWSISAVAVLFAVLHVVATMTMTVSERRRDIAIMRAVGWKRPMIVRVVLIEGLVVASVGGVLGIAAGIPVARAVAAMPTVGGLVSPEFDGQTLAYALAGTLVLALLGSIGPALSAASADPATILRGR